MKIFQTFILLFLYIPLLSFSNFEQLGKNEKILEEANFQFSNKGLKVVQKRWLEKKYLSEISVSASPILKGFNYSDAYSLDLSYRWFLNNKFGLNFTYSYYENAINKKGKDAINLRGYTPLELVYHHKQSYLAGIEWYPFYGKAVLYNNLVHFDLYFSILAGQIELAQQEKRAEHYSASIGLAQWWHKKFNTRLSLQGFYYRYSFSNKTEIEDIHEYFYKLSVSVGVLF